MRALVRFLLIFSFVSGPFIAEAQLVPSFTISSSSGCTPFFTSFHDATTGGTVSAVNWIFVMHGTTDTVGTATGAYATFNFTDTAFYDVTEIVSNSTDTADTTEYNAIHAIQPTVSFTTTADSTDTLLSCPGKTVTFVNTTTNAGCGSEFKWIFNNGTTVDSTVYTYSPTTTVTYTFSTPGYYNVTLYESPTSCSCSGFKTLYNFIKIDSVPVVCYSVSANSACGPPDTVHFFSSCTTSASSFVWHFGDHLSGAQDSSGLASPTHIYTATGFYTDSLTVYSAAGCRSFLSKVNDIRVGNFIPSFYINAVSPICADSAGKIINFQAPLTTGDHWYWHDTTNTHFGYVHDPNIGYFTPGVYVMIDSTWDTASGCAGTVAHAFTIYPTPEVSFSATPTYRCTPDLTASFTSLIIDTAAIDSFHWNFGDPASGVLNTSALPDPEHIYSAYGSYSPKIFIKDNTGCADSFTLSNYIKIDSPSFHIYPNADSGCTPFHMTYSLSVSPAVGYTVDSIVYGDAAHAFVPAAGFTSGTHTYSVQGVYTMIVTYTLPAAYGGCTYAATNTFVVGSVLPTFSPVTGPYAATDSVCPNAEAYFYSACTDCTSFTWNFGDGTTSHNFNDSDTYPNTGRVRVYAYGDLNGCVAPFNFYLQVLPPQASIIAAVFNCDSSNVFNFSNADSSGVTSYRWNFGDGAGSTLAAPSHTYTVPAMGESFPVTLIDSGGGSHHCFNKDSTEINIYPIIDTFNASDTAVCRLVPVVFTGPVPPAGAASYEYIWIFSSVGTPDTESSPTNIFSYPFTDTGIYNVRLEVINAYGCTKDTTRYGYIHVTGPIGGFTANGFTTGPVTGCVPFTVNFHDNNTVVAGSTITSRQWQFSGPGAVAGVPATLNNGYSPDTSYTYPEGSFRVVLIDSDNNHCFSYDSIRVKAQKPHAYFTANMTANCPGKPVTFTDTNTHCFYVWIFGDSTTDTGRIATHVYSATGVYTVSIVVTTDSTGSLPPGCTDTFTRAAYINISNIPVAISFISDSSALCPPLRLAVDVASRIPGYTYYWDIGHVPPYYPYTDSLFTYDFTGVGTYFLTLTDSNAIGCKDSVTSDIIIDGPKGYVRATPIVAAFP